MDNHRLTFDTNTNIKIMVYTEFNQCRKSKKGVFLMIEILEFIFSSFWVFAGVFLLVSVIGGYLTAIITSVFSSFTYRRKQ